jgi:hypothetical protein
MQAYIGPTKSEFKYILQVISKFCSSVKRDAKGRRLIQAIFSVCVYSSSREVRKIIYYIVIGIT